MDHEAFAGPDNDIADGCECFHVNGSGTVEYGL
jgi:hypothetical protein